MGIEIERKFLLRDASWRAGVERSVPMRQGYLLGASGAAGALASVRVRIAGTQAWLNIKQAVAGVARAEFEYAIPLADAQAMLATLCGGVLEKTRHYVAVAHTLFEIDEFALDNAGLIVAEVELPAIDSAFARPAWLGREVSAFARYYNVDLIAHPYRQWSAAERAADDMAC